MTHSWPLNVIAPNFEPGTVGGAGEVMVQLTNGFLRQHLNIKIYLNQSAARQFPQWSDHIIKIRTTSMDRPTSKAAAMLYLDLAGGWILPPDGISWFPFGAMMPFYFRGKGVATIHDTIDRDLPDQVPVVERYFRRIMIPRTTQQCAVITDSNVSRDRIRRHYGVEATVIPLASVPLPPPIAVELPFCPYVFYAANGWPHKNHKFLLETWCRNKRLRKSALVFTLGPKLGALAPLINRARMEGIEVVLTGRLSLPQLAAYYQGALCSALPSLYEGFGLTVQESLSANCPVVLSECAGLTESVPSGYPFIVPLKHDRWVEAILSIQRARPTDLKQWVTSKTWAEVATEYLKVFDLVHRATTEQRVRFKSRIIDAGEPARTI